MDLVECLSFLFQLNFSTFGKVVVFLKYLYISSTCFSSQMINDVTYF